MKIELKEFENCPMVKAGDLVICKNGFQYFIGTDGNYFKLISIGEHECDIIDEQYTFKSLIQELDYLGWQRIITRESLKLIEL